VDVNRYRKTLALAVRTAGASFLLNAGVTVIYSTCEQHLAIGILERRRTL
jgi:hypothetical protein